MAVQTIIRNTVNLEEPVVKKILRDMLGSQDEQAHRFEVEVKRGSEAVDLAGASVNGYFIRAGGETVMLTGGVEDGNAYVVLSDSCYRVPGHFSFAMKIQVGDVRHTVLWYEGTVGQTSSDSLVDPENVIPSLDDLLAQIERTEQAANTANTAAETAQQAADAANQFVNLTVEAVTLANGADATASYENGVLTIGLPKGPKGDTGSASPITVNGIEAIDSDITLTAADVGAMPDTYKPPVTSVNGQTGEVQLPASDPLAIYPIGSLFWSSNPTSPASLFGGTWTQIKDMFVLSAGDTYSNGATGGSASYDHMHYIQTRFTNFEHAKTWGLAITKGGDGMAEANSLLPTTSTTVSAMPPYIVKYCWERTA